MNLDKATPELFAALALAQGSIEAAKKDSVNPAFKSKYADISAVHAAAQEALKANGLSLTFSIGSYAQGVSMIPLLAHKAGGYIMFDQYNTPCDSKAQAQGSAITYGRRYLTMAILGIPAEDDDGTAASLPAPKAQPVKPAPKADSKPDSTHRKEVLAHLTAIKPQLTDEQVAELGKDLVHAGTTDAMLDAVKAKADKFLSTNLDASAAAMAAGFEGEVVA